MQWARHAKEAFDQVRYAKQAVLKATLEAKKQARISYQAAEMASKQIAMKEFAIIYIYYIIFKMSNLILNLQNGLINTEIYNDIKNEEIINLIEEYKKDPNDFIDYKNYFNEKCIEDYKIFIM